MRASVVALFLFAGVHGGNGGGCNCGHMASGPHMGGHGGAGHASFSTAHPMGTAGGRAAAAIGGHVAAHAIAHAVHHTFLHALTAGLRSVLEVGVDIVEAALGVETDSGEQPVALPPAPLSPEDDSCQSAEDCGDGQLGHGAVCDHWSRQPRQLGICREACRSDGDCPATLHCRSGLDPDDSSWAGCAE